LLGSREIHHDGVKRLIKASASIVTVPLLVTPSPFPNGFFRKDKVQSIPVVLFTATTAGSSPGSPAKASLLNHLTPLSQATLGHPQEGTTAP
jgi:hypothetical protein